MTMWERLAGRQSSAGTGFGATLAGLAAGAAAVALLSPREGARRRAEVVHKGIHAAKSLESFGRKAGKDLAGRSRGLASAVSTRMHPDHPDDRQLAERVRSRLGRLSSHPGVIEVSACEGVVELHGPVLAGEADQVIDGVCHVRGVSRVVDRLERHAQPGDIPGLQGGAGRPNPRWRMQANWAPATRLAGLGVGAALAGWGFARRGILGYLAGVCGAALATRAATNLEARRLVGVGAHRRAVDLQKSIFIAAPRAEVFAFFRNFESFPRFMSHVREVRAAGEGRWHWKVDGPAGTAVEWDAEVSSYAPDEELAWKTLPGAPVQSSGIVKFLDEAGGTRLHLRLSYNPPGGALGHVLAVLLGADPKHQLDDDMLRLKSLLERGKSEGTTREDVRPPPVPQG